MWPSWPRRCAARFSPRPRRRRCRSTAATSASSDGSRAAALAGRSPRAARPALSPRQDSLCDLPERSRRGDGDPRHGGARRAGNRLRRGFRGGSVKRIFRRLCGAGEKPPHCSQPVLGSRAHEARGRSRSGGQCDLRRGPGCEPLDGQAGRGALATAGHGTALGVIRSAKSKSISVIACETRPYLQGARLTAWECVQEGIPCTLITDSMAGHLMSRGEVDVVIVGADRIAANGDVANKIGTYSLAVLARRHGLPFYVAAPLSTFDRTIPDGSRIPIEERPADEVTGYRG